MDQENKKRTEERNNKALIIQGLLSVKIIYSILKEILEGDSIPKASDYEITEDQFFEIINLMKNENYLNPKKIDLIYIGKKSLNSLIPLYTFDHLLFCSKNSIPFIVTVSIDF